MDYDAALKSILQSLANKLTPALTGARPVELLSVEFESVKKRIADLVCWLDDGRIFHLEVQSYNDRWMAQRMLQYWLLLRERFPNAEIVQFVLYVGKAQCSMAQEYKDGEVSYRYHLIDVREMSEDVFLQSGLDSERALAVLTSVPDVRKTIRRILASWAGKPKKEREDLELVLMILSGLRELEDVVVEEIHSMPLTIDIMENKVIRRWIEGGIKQGTERGQSALLTKLLTKRFGALPEEIEGKLNSAHSEQLEHWALRLMDVSTLDEVFSE